MSTPAETLKGWRKRAELSQDAAATKAGVRQATWCEVEGGKRKPHLALAIRIEALTDGEVTIESWGYARELVARMSEVVARRIGKNAA